MTARTLSLALSIWVFASSFMLPRPDPSFTTAWVCGFLSAALAAGALHVERLRHVGVAVGAALALSPAVLPGEHATVRVHDLAVGLALAVLSLLPGGAPRRVARA